MTDSICEDSSKLSVRGLVKRFDGKETLHNLTFDVREGEFLSILGPSGCGKTTTLRILIGLLEPDEGMILLDGRGYHARGSGRPRHGHRVPELCVV